MANRKSYKSDVSFLKKISIGATGTIAVFNDLIEQGHNPIELERGSRSFKIWKDIKIKRIRVPDLHCIDCGKNIESRSKTKIEISMSHSKADPERGWDYGLEDKDIIAFVACNQASDRPIDWQVNSPVQYVSVRDLRSAIDDGYAVLTEPKGAEEGFEIRIIWPASVSNFPGAVKLVNENKIQYERRNDNRRITLKNFKKGTYLKPLVNEGDEVVKNQVIASVVPVSLNFTCDISTSEDFYIDLLSSSSLSQRYTAIKVLSTLAQEKFSDVLINKINDSEEHIYIKLEAAAGLVRQNNVHGYDFIEECLKSNYLQTRLETVIVLGEIDIEGSYKILINALLDKNQPPEIRAGAAWALGELHNRPALNALIESFGEIDDRIRVEAARALSKLAQQYTNEIIEEFPKIDTSKRPGVSWALSVAGRFDVDDMLSLLVDDDARQWVAYIVGTQDQEKYIQEIEELKKTDPEVYFAVTVLWKVMTSWIWGLEEY